MGKKITITGKVHNVGYRLFLLEEADALFIPYFDARYIKVDDKEVLVILVDGDDREINEFIEFVKNKRPEGAFVEEIKIEEYSGRIREIERFRSIFDTSQLSKIVQVGINMLEKQDKTIDILSSVKEDTSQMLEKQDKSIGEIRDLRKDLREYMDKRLSKIERELNGIKTALKERGII